MLFRWNIYRLSNQSLRLCSNHNFYIKHSVLFESRLDDRNKSIQKRNFSFQNTVESIAKTQTGIFKSLSESTPVEYIQKFLLSFHDTSGLPWWATIVCTTILLRSCVTLPLAVYQNYILAKLENLKLEMPEIAKELRKETAVAIKLYKWDEKKAKLVYNRSVSNR